MPRLEAKRSFCGPNVVYHQVYQTAQNACRRSQSGGVKEKDVDVIRIRHGMAAEDPQLIYE